MTGGMKTFAWPYQDCNMLLFTCLMSNCATGLWKDCNGKWYVPNSSNISVTLLIDCTRMTSTSPLVQLVMFGCQDWNVQKASGFAQCSCDHHSLLQETLLHWRTSGKSSFMNSLSHWKFGSLVSRMHGGSAWMMQHSHLPMYLFQFLHISGCQRLYLYSFKHIIQDGRRCYIDFKATSLPFSTQSMSWILWLRWRKCSWMALWWTVQPRH